MLSCYNERLKKNIIFDFAFYIYLNGALVTSKLAKALNLRQNSE